MDTLKCLRCETELTPHSVYNGLVELKRTSNGVHIEEDKVLPVLPHICPKCGYVELQIADHSLLR